ncbi:NADH-FMN oxidoreductase RutF, flavin reductase (DIM6/NTAB) family [Geopseudomonas sagittaria]|uniref:NADH-FMN oxidoreductase RutF, flavin reductase (DIM6/NTAB) family n=1 Tax=Geopseudomonas sagittaria TaxID=1135990 RepID=A0A1I5R4K1_9GAMM|nr:flavin reductase [Pseudomonas sagittaria]SFP52976.1 NADH-FMN oxidoreductase RutF, flavin reductase (DIM6/NTAB) family [Pseudomonas sagittaria]
MTTAENSMDPRQFRRALGNFASGVTIVTACGPDGHKVGVTANSFNSVSLEPPLILWSLDKRSSAWEVFKAASHFTVNLLASDQIALSNHFARPQEDKFAGIEYASGLGDAPVFDGCAGNFQCSHFQHIDGGDHWIMIGKVERYEDHGRAPLVYHQGGYAMVLPHPRGRKPESSETSDARDLLNTRLGDNLFYLMIQAVNACHPRFVQENLALNLRNSEARLLLVLDSAPNAGLGELQQAAAMPAQEVEDALVTLQERGYLESAGQRHQVTTAGRAKLEELWATVNKAQEDIFGTLSEGELEVVKKALRLGMASR